ncbi:hypothetical protein PAPYR_4954 [Paratrimastix pyriformis]|uniref:Uncharacterized protein n=1 Tax=Paratrimastix pyriformis TaxID=342808 RepID=A0ABQ8UN68_9EUKA|nr:hypothetical protein PAPYR_4954 [Paratrimastix pyriformis]
MRTGDSKKNEKLFEICGRSFRICEILSESHALHVWPSAQVLAEFLLTSPHLLRGKHVVELGAGCGLAGIAAAFCEPASMTLTDYCSRSDYGHVFPPAQPSPDSPAADPGDTVALSNCILNCRMNGLAPTEVIHGAPTADRQVRVCALNWADFGEPLLSYGPDPDVILGADTFYESADFEPLLATLYELLSRKRDAYFVTTYQPRSAHVLLRMLLPKWGFCVEEVAFTAHCLAPHSDEDLCPPAVGLYILRLCQPPSAALPVPGPTGPTGPIAAPLAPPHE